MAEPAFRDPDFVHLRMHSEYSISDGIVRIDAAVAAAAADGQPALALTDLSNLFGLVRFYKAARAAGVKPIAGCDVWVQHAETGSAAVVEPRAAARARSRRLPRAVRAAVAGVPRERVARPRRAALRMVRRRRHVGPDRAVGRAGRRRRPRARGGPARAGGRARDALVAAFPRRLLPRAAALRSAGRRDATSTARRRSRPSSACRWSRRTRSSSSRAASSSRTRRAPASRKARCSRIRAAQRRFTAEQYLKIAAARWRRCSPTSRRRSPTRSRSRSAAT